MPTTSNFGWTTPADTDLVKDGAAAIRTLGNGIDTSLVDLKGGTTGQVLAKASNTDLDYTWTNVDPLTILDAKGDLISATAADTPARLPVGTNGQYLQADSTTSTGLKWVTLSAGGMTQLATGSLSGATVALNSISGSYKNLQLVVRDYLAVDYSTTLRLRFNGDSNANRHRTLDSALVVTDTTFDSTSIAVSNSSVNSGSDGLIIVDIYDYANTTTWKMLTGDAITPSDPATRLNSQRVLGAYNQTAAITSITIFPSSGNFNSGTYILYGVS